jgi:hypothetical protein
VKLRDKIKKRKDKMGSCSKKRGMWGKSEATVGKEKKGNM